MAYVDQPEWSKWTANNTGAAYKDLIDKFDPWGNWGRYGPSQNGQKIHQVGGGWESDTDRVYRWTNDILRNQYGYTGGEDARAQGLRTQIYLANVERLKSEYANSKRDWGTSAFANMDKQLAADQAARAAAGGGGQRNDTTPPVANDPALTGYKGTNLTGANPLGNTAVQRLGLATDPDRAYRYMMQQLGYNPSAPGLLGGFLKQRFQPLLEARMGAAGVGDNANYMDVVDQVINEFGGQLFTKGGNFFGNLRQIGNDAATAGRPFLEGLQDQQQAQQYMNQLGMLRYAGANPLVQQAQADQMTRAREAYEDWSFQEEGAGRNIDPYTQWLMQSQYKNLFGL